MPKISVIIAVYNAQDTLRRCMDSVTRQTLRDIEIICVDDGSKDDSPAILREYAAVDERVKVICQENAGAGAARNRGMLEACGEYFSILDSDDFFAAEMLEKSYARAKETDADIVVFGCDFYHEVRKTYSPCKYSLREQLIPKKDVFSMADVEKDAFKTFVGWTWDKLIRSDLVRRHTLRFQEIRSTNDLAFTYSALFSAERIAVLREVMVHYSQGANTLSHTREKSWQCVYEALRVMGAFLRKKGCYTRFERDFKNYCVHFLLWHYRWLKEPARSLMLEKMCTQWFEEFDLLNHPEEYFYNQSEYDLFRALCSVTPGQLADRPQVSVVMPSLNVAPYIRECIESVLNQTLKEIEIICVDAGSTDGTWEILQEYAAQDQRIKLIRSVHRSYGFQVNMGYYAAIGKYFAIVETDDIIDRNMYAELTVIADCFNVDVVKADFVRFAVKNGNIIETPDKIAMGGMYNYPMEVRHHYGKIIQGAKLYTWSGIYRREFLAKNNILHNETPGASYQDNGYWFMTMTNAQTVYFYDKPMYKLRRDNPNSSVFSKGKVYCIRDEYEFILNQLREDPERYAFAMPYYWYARMRNYMFSLSRIGDEHKKEFLMHFHAVFKEHRKELDRELYSQAEWGRLTAIMDDPAGYYNKNFKKKAPPPPKEQQVQKKNGVFRGFFRCISEHGLKYTLKYGMKRVVAFMHRAFGIKAYYDAIMARQSKAEQQNKEAEERQRRILKDIEYFNRLNEDRANRVIAQMRIHEYLQNKANEQKQ